MKNDEHPLTCARTPNPRAVPCMRRFGGGVQADIVYELAEELNPWQLRVVQRIYQRRLSRLSLDEEDRIPATLVYIAARKCKFPTGKALQAVVNWRDRFLLPEEIDRYFP